MLPASGSWGGTVQLSAGQFIANGGTWNSTRFQGNGSILITQDGMAFNNCTVNVPVEVQSTTRFGVGGTSTLNTAVQVSGSLGGGGTSVAALTGAGTVFLNNGSIEGGSDSRGTLTLGPALTIRCGTGNGTFTGLNVTNQGTLLVGSATSTLTLQGDNFRNTGVIQVNAGTLQLASLITPTMLGTVSRTGGSVVLRNTFDFGNGSYNLDSGLGSLVAQSGRFQNGTLNGQSLVTMSGYCVVSSATIAAPINMLSGTLEFGGEVRIDSTLTSAGRISINGNIGGAGTVTLSQAASGSATVTGNTYSIATPLTIRGGASGGQISGLSVTNSGTLIADTPGQTLIIDPSQWSSSGSLYATTGATLSLGGTWKNTGSISVAGGTLAAGGTFTTQDISSASYSGGALLIKGRMTSANSVPLALNNTADMWRNWTAAH